MEIQPLICQNCYPASLGVEEQVVPSLFSEYQERFMTKINKISAAKEFANFNGTKKYKAILADPPWQFINRTGKMAPEHKRLNRYSTLTLQEICEIPVYLAATPA